MSETNKVRPVSIGWDRGRCTGCLSCVVVCSERRTGTSAPSRARIRVLVDPLGGELDARYCRQCKNALCAEACPEDAIGYDRDLRAWQVEGKLCIGCGMCVEACPFEAIWLDTASGTAIKCDLCMGDTWCVEVCPTQALSVRGRGVWPS